jgi:hypothetical protein
MKKAPAAVSSRKPPTPTDNHDDIAQWMRRVMPDLQPLVQRLDEMIRETLPGLQYAVKWKKAHYGLPENGWVMEMVAYDISVNLVFFAGKDFDPAPPLGTTGRTRYVKLKSVDELEQSDVRTWIEQAGRHPGWK